MIAFVNNRFVEEDLATLGVNDISIQRGYGLFDYFRTNDHFPLFIDDYLDRFFNSAKLLRLQPPHSKDELKGIVGEMIHRNNIPDSGFRLLLTGGYSADNFEPATPNFIILQQAVNLPSPEKFQKGYSLILHEYMRDVPYAKSINYLMSIYLLDKIRQQNADDLLYHKDNCILELPRSNIFIVTKDGTVATPSLNVLQGITRKRVLEISTKHYKTEQRDVPVDELKNAAEVFITSTTKRIIPVTKIDDKPIGNGTPGPITTELLRLYVEMEEGVLRKAVNLF
jgi:branched-chain amino acid aminotransferase